MQSTSYGEAEVPPERRVREADQRDAELVAREALSAVRGQDARRAVPNARRLPRQIRQVLHSSTRHLNVHLPRVRADDAVI